MIDGPPQPADDDNAKAQQRRRLVRRLAVVGPLVLGLLVIYVFWLPTLMYPSLTDTDLRDVKTAQDEPDAAKIQELKGARLKLQNDARTTLLQGLGAVLVLTGATAGVWATLRQVQATRDQIRETATASRNQLKLSEQGQVTDRYTRAVDQLGHEKAPVRLGALYSLDHLAQDNPDYRQTVVDVFCAYLRMPYTVSTHTEVDAEQLEEKPHPADGRGRASQPAPERDPAREELQVRKTAQRLLADHLRCPPENLGQEAQLLPPSPQETFWPGISLDLTGAALINFPFHLVSVIQAQFVGATFQGDARFNRATFQGNAGFAEATFQGDAGFAEATFQGDAGFAEATFQGDAGFRKATFQGDARFGEATFQGDARFTEATFQGNAWFTEATFHDDAWFREATFYGNARFTEATFQGDAWFREATFHNNAGFGEATFHNNARFTEATFKDTAWFTGATFQGDAGFREATFQDTAWFAEATFQGDAGFPEATFQGNAWFTDATFHGNAWFREAATFHGDATFSGAHVLHFVNRGKHRMWPDGWIVLPDPTDPSRGTLVHAEHAKEPKPAAPPSDHTDNR